MTEDADNLGSKNNLNNLAIVSASKLLLRSKFKKKSLSKKEAFFYNIRDEVSIKRRDSKVSSKNDHP